MKAGEIRDCIAKVLAGLDFSWVKSEESKQGSFFQGFVIRAADVCGRTVETTITREGEVKDEFHHYDGHSCVGAADNYAKLLVDEYGVKMEGVVETPHDGRPLLRTAEEAELPRSAEGTLNG